MKSFSLSFNRVTVLSIVAGLSLVFSSCSSDEEGAGAGVSPKEAVINYASNGKASMLMSIRLGDLIDKSGVMEDLLPAEMKMMVDGYMSQFLDSKENGLDLDQTAFVLTDLKGIPQAPAMMGVVLAVSDMETFSAFVEGQTRMQPEEGDGYKYISMGNSGVIAWNSGMAAFFGGADFQGSSASKSLENLMKSLTEKGKKDTKAIAKFADKKADFGMYMDFENYMDIMPKDEMSAVFLDNELYKSMMKGGSFSGYMNFEAGKVTAEYDMSGNKQMKEFVKSSFSKGNPDFANYLGGENLIGFGTVSMNIDAILDFYEKIGFFDSPEIAEGLEKMKMVTGLSVRDIANKFSGDFAISFVGIEEMASTEVSEENEYSGYYEARKSTKPVIAAAIGIRDSLMGKIFDTIPALKKKGNYYQFPEGGMCLKNGIMFITTDMMLLEDFALDGRLTTYNKNNAQKSIGTYPMYGYFSFDALSLAMTTVDPEVATAVSQLDYAEMTITKEGTFKSVLYFKDKKTNSLKSLGKLIMDSASKSGMMF